MPKTKQQAAQERRLKRNVEQAREIRAEAKGAGRKGPAPRVKPSVRGGFFGLRAMGAL